MLGIVCVTAPTRVAYTLRTRRVRSIRIRRTVKYGYRPPVSGVILSSYFSAARRLLRRLLLARSKA